MGQTLEQIEGEIAMYKSDLLLQGVAILALTVDNEIKCLPPWVTDVPQGEYKTILVSEGLCT